MSNPFDSSSSLYLINEGKETTRFGRNLAAPLAESLSDSRNYVLRLRVMRKNRTKDGYRYVSLFSQNASRNSSYCSYFVIAPSGISSYAYSGFTIHTQGRINSNSSSSPLPRTFRFTETV